MAIIRRGKKLWITYSVPKALADRYGCPTRQRESSGSGDRRAAEALLAQRKREIKSGDWAPPNQGGHGLTVAEFAKRWNADRKRRRLLSADRDMERIGHLLEKMGPMRVGDVKRKHVRDAVTAMMRRDSDRGKPYAPGSIRLSYAVLAAMFGEAVRTELILVNPCNLRAASGEMPKNTDANPAWRAGAIFTRAEIQQLISDKRLPEVRRVLWALIFFTGMRLGEAAARTWADYDPVAEPLGRLVVATQHEGRRLKTDRPREVPVHVELARLLAAWKLEGYARAYGKRPQPDDLITRHRLGGRWTLNSVWKALQADLETLGLRARRVHDLRRTFISLARADGASELLKWVTHGPGSTVFDSYTSPPWSALCAQVSVLRVAPIKEAEVVSIDRKKRQKAGKP